MRLPGPKNRRVWQGRLLVAVTLAVGLLLSVTAYRAVRRSEDLQGQRELDRAADARVTAIRHELRTTCVTLQMLRAFHLASREVEREEFLEFTGPLLRSVPGIRALAWVPRVPASGREALEASAVLDGVDGFGITERSAQGGLEPAGERAEYFPVLYDVGVLTRAALPGPCGDVRGSRPAAGRTGTPNADGGLWFAAPGLDLASEPFFRATLAQAAESGEAAATARLRLGQGPGDGWGVVRFLPLYRRGPPAGSPAERLENLEGFFMGVFHIGELVEAVLAPLAPVGVDLLLQDLSAPEPERFLYARTAGGRAWDGSGVGPPAAEPGGSGSPAGWSAVHAIPVAGRQWSARVSPSPEFLRAYRTRQPFVVLFLGLFCTGVVAALFGLTARGNARLAAFNAHLRHEIRERRQAQADLQNSEGKFRALFLNAPVGIGVAELDGRPVMENDALREMFGLAGREPPAADVAQYYSDPGERARLLAEVRAAGAVRDRQVRMRRQDGTEFLASLTMVLFQVGTAERVVSVAEDITERRLWEEEAAKVQRLESLGILAGGIAHDFNNMLTAILSNLSMARIFGNLESDIAEMVADAERATLRARGLTQQLLAFAKGGAPVKKALSVSRLLRETVKFSLSGSNVRCLYELPDDLWPVEADEAQIGQVVQNLVINADQAMAEGGTLAVRARNVTRQEQNQQGGPPPGRYVRISFEDQGSGIPEKVLSKIFDPFFTTKGRGRGLGLATAFSIVNGHGGHLTVESRVGVGTRVDVLLPATEEPPCPEAAHKEGPTGDGGRALLVDDEETIRKSTGEVLKRLGYEAVSARDGREGIGLYEEALRSGERFDVVILDLTIPGGMGGREAARALLEIDPDARLVASSGYADDPILARHREHGFRAAVRKPYQMEEMAQALREARAGPPATSPGDTGPPRRTGPG